MAAPVQAQTWLVASNFRPRCARLDFVSLEQTLLASEQIVSANLWHAQTRLQPLCRLPHTAHLVLCSQNPRASYLFRATTVLSSSSFLLRPCAPGCCWVPLPMPSSFPFSRCCLDPNPVSPHLTYHRLRRVAPVNLPDVILKIIDTVQDQSASLAHRMATSYLLRLYLCSLPI